MEQPNTLDLEDTRGALSMTKLVVVLTNLRRDITALHVELEQIEKLAAKVRSAETVSIRITQEFRTIKKEIRECTGRLDECQLAISTFNEKYGAHLVVADQFGKSLNTISRELVEDRNKAQRIEERITALSYEIRSLTSAQEITNESIKQLRSDIDSIDTLTQSHQDRFTKIGATYSTVLLICTAIFSLVSIGVAIWTNLCN